MRGLTARTISLTGSPTLIASLALIGSLTLAACGEAETGGSAASGSDPPGDALVGTFHLDPGTCSGGSTHATADGTYFRMITPGGSIDAGPFFQNPDSTCSDKTFTLATPGTDGGLVTGSYQPNPDPAFNSTGSAIADRIVAPQSFTAIDFGISTNPVDPQTGLHVPAPAIEVSGSTLRGQIEAWSAAWNNQYFNQGTPKVHVRGSPLRSQAPTT